VCYEEFGLGEEVLGCWRCVVQVGPVVVCGSAGGGPFVVVNGCGWSWCAVVAIGEWCTTAVVGQRYTVVSSTQRRTYN